MCLHTKQLGEKSKGVKSKQLTSCSMFPYSNINIASFSPKIAPPSLFSLRPFPQTTTCSYRLTLVVVAINSLETASGVFKEAG